MEILVQSHDDIEKYVCLIQQASERTRHRLTSFQGSGVDLFNAMKFDALGEHPTKGHALNVIEQVNQTATYLAALAATKILLGRHTKVSGYRLAPGAHAAQAYDLMSIEEGVVCAEIFSAVDPNNNRKLSKDLKRLSDSIENYRYIFFASPRYPQTSRQEKLEKNGVEVWSVVI